MTAWQKQQGERAARLQAAAPYASGKLVPPENAKPLLEAIIRPGDRICLEGDNQKQADFLAEALAGVDRSRIHDLHIVQSGIVLQAHLDLFERGIARKLDFSYSGPQGAAIARALVAGKIELGSSASSPPGPARSSGSPRDVLVSVRRSPAPRMAISS
jgi:malonate decarboxylase alpha subunit